MEFKEFTNPEEKNYDLNHMLDEHIPNSNNPYDEQLFQLLGILEDVTDEELQEQYGISMEEYLHPTEETINKVKDRMNGFGSHR